jgi:hypothetical protein
MHKRAVIASTAVTAVAATTFAVNAAQASQGDRARENTSDRTNQTETHITVVERAVSDAVVDNKPKGDSIGDLLAFGNPVYDKTNSKKVGRDHGFCIRTVVGKAWECSFTVRLDKGALVVEGPFYDAHGSVLAITGGTGAYSRARGEMHLQSRNKKGTAYTFRFVIKD